MRISAIVVIGRRITLSPLRRFVRTSAIGRSWPVIIVIWRRGPRGLAARGSRLRTVACPRRTISLSLTAYLRSGTSRTIGASETCRCAATIGCISLRFPGALAIPGALRRTIPGDRGGCAVRVSHRRRRPILREFPLAGRSHLGCSRRIARTVIHRRRVARTIIRHGCVARWHVLCGRALIHRAVHRSITGASGTQASAVDGVHAHLGRPLRRRGARDHCAVLN